MTTNQPTTNVRFIIVDTWGHLGRIPCSLANLMYGDFFDRNEKPCRPFANFEVYEFMNQLSLLPTQTPFSIRLEQFWDFSWGEDYFQNIWPTRRFEGFVRWICSVMWMAQPCNAAGSFLISQWFSNPPTPKSVQTFGKMTIWLEAVLHFWLMFFVPWNWLSFRISGTFRPLILRRRKLPLKKPWRRRCPVAGCETMGIWSCLTSKFH